MEDVRLHCLAGSQHWLITHDQLLGLGYSDRKVELRLASGFFVRVHRGVYRLRGAKPTFESNVLAACMVTGGVASYRSAGTLFGLRGIKPGPVEITVEAKRAPRLSGVTTHQTNRLHAATIGILPVTTPLQTLLDLARVEPRLVEGAVNHALGRGLVKLPKLARFVEEATGPGRPSTARLREVIEAQIKGVNPTESWLEDRLLELIRRYELPEPQRQYWVDIAEGKRIRFDFAYPAQRLALEADSRLFHSTPADRRRDAARDDAARRAGWEVERVTWLQMEEQPAVVAARIGAFVTFVKQAA